MFQFEHTKWGSGGDAGYPLGVGARPPPDQGFLVVVPAALPPVRRPEKASGRAQPFLPTFVSAGEVQEGPQALLDLPTGPFVISAKILRDTIWR